MARVKLERIEKAFGPVKVIHGVDVDIADGEFIVILGPSGCGKSTLLRIVAGLESPTAGDVHIGDRVVTGVEPKDRNIAMVFQNYALYPHMSVRENMAYGLKIRGMAKDEIERRVQAAARTLELGALLDRKPKQLSGGQRQRVAMGRAIVREAEVFLFDEPLSNLDAKLRVQTRMEIQALHRRLGTTSLYVTHDQVEAMTLANRIVVMNGGRVEQVGTPREIYERPATAFVAGFIGAPPMNLVEAKVDTAAERLVLGDGVALAALPPAAAGGTLKVGIRPEQITFGAAGNGALPFEVDLVETLGADHLVHGRIAGQPVIVRSDRDDLPGAGEQVWANVPLDRLHFFAAESGRRITN